MPNFDKQPKDMGVLMEAVIGYDFIPIFQIIEMQPLEKNNAKAHALRWMKEQCKHCALFIRADGMHEAWTRGDLEAWRNGGPPTYTEPSPRKLNSFW